MTGRRADRVPSTLRRALSRRAALRGAAGSLVAGLATVAGLERAVAGGQSTPPPAPLPLPPGGSPVREFTLTSQEFAWDLMPGTTVRAWGYNGQVPGPEVRVREGDRVRVTLRNRLPVPTTIHWHGVNVPPSMDGPAGLN